MAKKVYGFDESGFRRVQAAVRRIEGTPRRGSHRRPQLGVFDGAIIADAELTASLAAATNSKTGAATAAAKFLVPDPDNPGDLEDGDTFTITNRSLDATGLAGDYCIVAMIGTEWRLIWIDC